MHNGNYQLVSPLPNHLSSNNPMYSTSILRLNSVVSNSYTQTYVSLLNSVSSAFYKPNFLKIKFRGKGYYIYKNIRNAIAPQFGYSHRLYIYSYFNKVKFIGKTKIILFGLTKLDIVDTATTLKSKRPINIFTGRGVRFARQVVYKKQGKVSSYR
jgi:ribosomal protein L6P/L9E